VSLFLSSALDGGQWSPSCPSRFTSQEKNPRYPLDRMLGGSQSRSGRCGEDKEFGMPGMEPEPSSPYPITIPTLLSRHQIQKDGLDEAYGTHVRDEKCQQNLDWISCSEMISWEM
jgi:hypothetical protein